MQANMCNVPFPANWPTRRERATNSQPDGSLVEQGRLVEQKGGVTWPQ